MRGVDGGMAHFLRRMTVICLEVGAHTILLVMAAVMMSC